MVARSIDVRERHDRGKSFPHLLCRCPGARNATQSAHRNWRYRTVKLSLNVSSALPIFHDNCVQELPSFVSVT